MNFRFQILTVIALSLLLVLPSSAEANTSIPKMLDGNQNVGELADFIDDRQLLVLHDSTPVKTPSDTKGARFVSSMAVVDTPVEELRRTVTNYENYENFLPTLENVTSEETEGETDTVNINFELRLGVVNPNLYYTVDYYPGPDGDLLWHRTKGDIPASYGRWEFQKLSDTRTLVVYTSWSDFSDLGWSVDSVLWAQPDLKLAIPVSQAAVVMKNLREHVTSTPSVTTTASTEPDVPLFAGGSIPDQLVHFTERGTPMVIHPEQYIQEKSGDTLGLSFVSAVGAVNGSEGQAKEYLTRFEKFPDFVEQVSNVTAEETDAGHEATWELSMGLGVLSLGIDYSLDYEWQNEQSLVFRRTGGDLTHVYGALEWVPLEENRTLFFYTTATQIGENAGYLMKLGNLIPNKQIVIGVSAGALAVEKQIEWANDQLKRKNRPASDPN